AAVAICSRRNLDLPGADSNRLGPSAFSMRCAHQSARIVSGYDQVFASQLGKRLDATKVLCYVPAHEDSRTRFTHRDAEMLSHRVRHVYGDQQRVRAKRSG